jgi:hypothetical protein
MQNTLTNFGEIVAVVTSLRLEGLSRREISERTGIKNSKLTHTIWEHLPWPFQGHLATRSWDKEDLVIRYLDSTVHCDICLTASEIAQAVEVAEAQVKEWIGEWFAKIHRREHFPVCKCCHKRGSTTNPIMENGSCLDCNARANNWPIDSWIEDGKLYPLLKEMGCYTES